MLDQFRRAVSSLAFSIHEPTIGQHFRLEQEAISPLTTVGEVTARIEPETLAHFV